MIFVVGKMLFREKPMRKLEFVGGFHLYREPVDNQTAFPCKFYCFAAGHWVFSVNFVRQEGVGSEDCSSCCFPFFASLVHLFFALFMPLFLLTRCAPVVAIVSFSPFSFSFWLSTHYYYPTRTDFVQRPAALKENKIWRRWITLKKWMTTSSKELHPTPKRICRTKVK